MAYLAFSILLPFLPYTYAVASHHRGFSFFTALRFAGLEHGVWRGRDGVFTRRYHAIARFRWRFMHGRRFGVSFILPSSDMNVAVNQYRFLPVLFPFLVTPSSMPGSVALAESMQRQSMRHHPKMCFARFGSEATLHSTHWQMERQPTLPSLFASLFLL